MLEVVKFNVEHCIQLRKQKEQFIELDGVTLEHYKQIEKLNYSWTILVDNIPMACVGVVNFHSHKGEAWAIIDCYSGKHFVSIVRSMKRILDIIKLDRIEATVQKNFKQAHRLVKLLGFELEAETMRKYGVNGLDYSLYARVK